MPNRTEARPAKAVLTYVTGSLPLLRLFSTPLKIPPDRCPIRGTCQPCPQGRVQTNTPKSFRGPNKPGVNWDPHRHEYESQNAS